MLSNRKLLLSALLFYTKNKGCLTSLNEMGKKRNVLVVYTKTNGEQFLHEINGKKCKVVVAEKSSLPVICPFKKWNECKFK